MSRAAREAEAKGLVRARWRMLRFSQNLRPWSSHYQTRCDHPYNMINLLDADDEVLYYKCADCGAIGMVFR